MAFNNPILTAEELAALNALAAETQQGLTGITQQGGLTPQHPQQGSHPQTPLQFQGGLNQSGYHNTFAHQQGVATGFPGQYPFPQGGFSGSPGQLALSQGGPSGVAGQPVEHSNGYYLW